MPSHPPNPTDAIVPRPRVRSRYWLLVLAGASNAALPVVLPAVAGRQPGGNDLLLALLPPVLGLWVFGIADRVHLSLARWRHPESLPIREALGIARVTWLLAAPVPLTWLIALVLRALPSEDLARLADLLPF